MREHVAEFRAQAQRRKGSAKPDPEREVLAKIDGFPEPDRSLGRRVHEIVKASAPGLTARLWYGMPAYSNAEGEIVCFFQNGSKFKTRYATLGFSDEAKLDDGQIWPTAYALARLSPADEAKIAALVRRAVG